MYEKKDFFVLVSEMSGILKIRLNSDRWLWFAPTCRNETSVEDSATKVAAKEEEDGRSDGTVEGRSWHAVRIPTGPVRPRLCLQVE